MKNEKSQYTEIKLYTRKCHDCGIKTNNYRCQKCLEEWKVKHGVIPNALEYTPASTKLDSNSHKY